MGGTVLLAVLSGKLRKASIQANLSIHSDSLKIQTHLLSSRPKKSRMDALPCCDARDVCPSYRHRERSCCKLARTPRRAFFCERGRLRNKVRSNASPPAHGHIGPRKHHSRLICACTCSIRLGRCCRTSGRCAPAITRSPRQSDLPRSQRASRLVRVRPFSECSDWSPGAGMAVPAFFAHARVLSLA